MPNPLTADRNSEAKYTERTLSVPVAASAEIFNGGMVCANLTGYAVAGVATPGFVVLGRACEYVNNTGSDGALRVRVIVGVFSWENDAHAVTQADVGRICYLANDQTVADVTQGSSVVAGIVDSIDPETDEIWVRTMDADFTGDDASAIETVTDGEISIYTRTSLLSITGTQAYTLAAGLYEGQRKTLFVIATATTPAGTVTPVVYADGTNFHMSAVGERIELEYHAANGWRKLNDQLSLGAPETVTAGAISLFTRVTNISITGTQAYALGDGLFIGQRKTLIVTVAGGTPAGTLTPVTYVDGATHLFQAVDERLELEWVGATGWKKLSSVESLGAPETVTTGALSLYTQVSLLSVTGTVAFSLPDGLFVGQRKTVICSVAGSTPVGTLTPATTPDAATHIFGGIGERLELLWVGSTGWKVIDSEMAHTVEDTVSSGAISVLTRVTLLDVTGTQTYQLANGLYAGQIKWIRCTVAGSTPNGTLTPATPVGFATADFDAVNECYCFIWNGAGWECGIVNSDGGLS